MAAHVPTDPILKFKGDYRIIWSLQKLAWPKQKVTSSPPRVTQERWNILVLET